MYEFSAGERPYECSFCDKGYHKSQDLKMHVLKMHVGEQLNCELCGEGFVMQNVLNQHKRTAHGIYLNNGARVDTVVGESSAVTEPTPTTVYSIHDIGANVCQ